MLINCPLRTAALHSPEAAAITDGERSLTFARFDHLAQTCMDGLSAVQISAGSYCAILAQNSIEYAALLFAVARLGAVAVPLNTRLSPGELRTQLEQIDPILVLADRENLEMARQVTPRVSPIESLVQQSATTIDDQNDIQIEPETTSYVVFTSGSSGIPKGVELSFGNFYFNALGSNENLPVFAMDTWLLSLPLFHVGGIGILFRCLLAGARTFITSRFDPDSANHLIDSGEVSHLSVVPTMLVRLLESRNRRPLPSSLKSVLLGGAPVTAPLLAMIRDLHIPAVISYGLTETASQVTATSLPDSPDHLQTSGKALRYAEVKIDSESNVGEICVRGKIVCNGYLGNKSMTAAEDGWLRTGDIGSLDNDGYLTLLGRKDEMFISGGENIYPVEISAVAEAMPDIIAAAVVPVEHHSWGCRPVLFVEVRQGAALDHQRLLDQMGLSLAKYKLPDRIFVLDQLPRTALGKVDRQELIRMAIAAMGK